MDEVLRPGDIKPKSSQKTYERPFDVIELPSRGKLYKGTTLEGRTDLEVYYLTAKDEDILTSPNLIQSGKMIDYLMKSVIKDQSIDPNDLVLGDRNTIIVWLRSTGYGEDYPVQVQCGRCGEIFKQEFNLSELDTIYLEADPDESGLFSFTLPVTKKIVKFKLINCRDESEITELVESRKRNTGMKVDNTNSQKLFKEIVMVDGSDDPMFVRSFLEGMPAKDARAFREYLNSIEPGIDMKQEAICTQCGHTSKEAIPIRTNFFWPDFEG